MNSHNITVIILAAGMGTRMKSDLPKVLHTINNRPILAYALDTLEQLKLQKIIIVVGYKSATVKEIIGSKWEYAGQKKLTGTASAVGAALSKIPQQTKVVMVLNGDDSAFYKPSTMQEIINRHLKSGASMTIVTSVQSRAEISGRVIRDNRGNFVGIKPNSQMSKKELETLNEVVCGIYLFNPQWLKENLPKVPPSRSGQYNITYLIGKARQKHSLLDIRLENPDEWRSINTRAELELARSLWSKLNS